ncbi:MAG TPA: hypothetical protein VL361_14780 [Candidatus Limnocylindrales bacterium]|nr:hypothetical protein [Candidatus Limnocylindrales bacterium]
MLERVERILRLACVVLAAALLVRFVWGIAHINPLAHLKIPAVPTLAAQATAAGGKATNTVSIKSGPKQSTNTVAGAKPTEQTNSSTARKSGTNTASESVVQKTNSTNLTAKAAALETNTPSSTNVVTRTNSVPGTNVIAAATSEQSRTNTSKEKNTTNALAESRSQAKSTSSNSAPPKVAGNVNPPSIPGMPPKPRELSPEIQARVDRITDSEILGPVMRPMPMALLGIAGNVAFIRTATGQTGLVKEGEDLGDLKLLRIGTNRVLVEQEGQKKELMIFSGLGGESLVPKESTSPP